MYPSGHYTQPPYGYAPPPDPYYGTQHPPQHQYWPQAPHSQPLQTQPYPQPAAAAALAKPRFPSSKQWRRDDKSGGGKSQYFFSEAPENKRQKLDSPTQGSPVSQTSSVATRPDLAPGHANPQPFHTQPPFGPQSLPHTPAPTPPAGWVPPPQPYGWPGQSSATPHHPPTHGYHPPSLYHQGYPPPQPNPTYAAAPTPGYPHGVVYPQMPYPGPHAPPAAYQYPPSVNHSFPYHAQQQSTTPNRGHWRGRPRDASFSGHRGRGHHHSKLPPYRQFSSPLDAHSSNPKTGSMTSNNQKLPNPFAQTSPPHFDTPEPSPRASLDIDENAWIDCEPDEYWPKEEEFVPELGIGFVVWRPPQSVSRVMPSTFEAVEQWSKTLSQYAKRKDKDSVSKYVWEARLEEHCLPIAVTEGWKEVEDDPIFVEFHKESRLIPLEEVMSKLPRPIVKSGDGAQSGASKDVEDTEAAPTPPDEGPQSVPTTSAGIKRSTSEALGEDELYSPTSLDPPVSPRSTSAINVTPAPLQTPVGAKDVQSNSPIESTSSQATTQRVEHGLPKRPEASLYRPNIRNSTRIDPQHVREYPSNNVSMGPVRDQAQEDALARLGVTGSPKPKLSHQNQPGQTSRSMQESDPRCSPNTPITGTTNTQASQSRSNKRHAAPPRPPPPPPSEPYKFQSEVDMDDPWSQGLHKKDQADSPGTDGSNHTVAGSDFDDGHAVEDEKNEIENFQQPKLRNEAAPPENNDQSKGRGSIRKRPRGHSDEPDDFRRQEDDTFGRHRKRGPKVNAVYNRRW